MAQFAGTWKSESSENVDAFLKELGVSWPLRQLANAAKPTLEVTVAGNHFVFKQMTPLSTMVTEFELDVEWDEKTSDGRHCKSIVRLVDGHLVEEQKGQKVTSTYDRWVEGDTLFILCECNGVKSLRKYRKQ